MAKAKHTNKGERNRLAAEGVEEDATVEAVEPTGEAGMIGATGLAEWPEPVITDGGDDVPLALATPWYEGHPLDYGEGKTREQEAEDSVAMIGWVFAGVAAVIIAVVLILVVIFA